MDDFDDNTIATREHDGITYRAVILRDTYPEGPDHDGQGYMFYMERGRFALQHKESSGTTPEGKVYGTPNVDFNLDDLWDQYRDMDAIETVLRAEYDVQGVAYFDTQDGKYVNIVTTTDLDCWGRPDLKGKSSAEVCEHNLDAWRAYADGEVYYFVIQKAVAWTTEDPDHDEYLTTWDDVDSCGGFFGDEYAKEAALESLDNYAPKDN